MDLNLLVNHLSVKFTDEFFETIDNSDGLFVGNSAGISVLKLLTVYPFLICIRNLDGLSVDNEFAGLSQYDSS